MRTPLCLRLAFVGCGTAAACIVVFIGMAVATGGFFAAGMHVTSAEANSTLHQGFELPDSAADVNYSTSVWFSTVDLKISEKAFFDWCQHKGWAVQRIPADDPGTRRFFHDDGTESVTRVSHGYWFSDREGDTGFSGVFDRDAGRASVMFTSR